MPDNKLAGSAKWLTKLAVLFVIQLIPTLAFAGACTTESVSSLLGTSCSIGDVEYSFIATGPFGFHGTGISAISLTFTPGGTLLDPEFTITGPLSVSATGLGNSASLSFYFLWSATVIPMGLQIGLGTNTLNGAVVPDGPSYGSVDAGNNVLSEFAIVQTNGPNRNPDSSGDIANLPLDGIFFGMFAQDGTGNGATVSITSTDYQYSLVPTPEPSPLLLLGTGLLGLGPFLRRHRRRIR